MDQEIENRLSKIEKMVSDNNRMLSAMRRAQKNAAYMRALYWLIIIVLGIASFYVIKPYITSLTSTYSSLTGNDTAGSSDSTSTLMNLLKQYESGQKSAQ